MGTGTKAALVGVAMLLLLVVGAVVVVMTINGGRTPEQAVRDYVRLIATGDGAAADAVVAPGSRGAAVALRSATAHIAIESVGRDRSADDASGPTRVEVRYTLGRAQGSASLRVREAPGFSPLTRYQILDPLVVPVELTSVPALSTARVGTVRVPVNAEDERHRRATLLYPGEYRVAGQPSPYLSADARPAIVAADTLYSPGGKAVAVPARVVYAPNARLRRLVQSKIAAHVRACAAAAPKVPRDCPLDMFLFPGKARHVKITTPFRFASFEPGAASGALPFSFRTVAKLGPVGAIIVAGRVGVTAGGAVTVHFDGGG